MRVLVVGATGMIGAALVDKLTAAGHVVLPGVRNVDQARARWPGAHVVGVDLMDPDMAARWPALLAGVDAVINAVGIFREQGTQTFDALHVQGPQALLAAATAAGVRIVQISALGADPDSPTAYWASKGRADATLRALGGMHTVVRPSLVFAAQGASTRWFARLAALPLTPLPGGGRQSIQPLHLQDLCDAIVRLLADPRPPQCVDAVGVEPVSLRNYLACFKQALRLPGIFVSVPMAWVRLLARPLSRISRLITPEALSMLEKGNTADSSGFIAVLGRQPRPVHAFFDDADRSAMRRRAQLAWLVPLLRYAVAITWIVTGYVSAFEYPERSSLDLLARTGLVGATATLALYGAATLDVLLGVLTLLPRSRRWAYRAQFVLILLYTAIITAALPEYWMHPYGPILKNLPMLAAIVALHELDDAHGAAHGPGRR